MRHKTLHYLFSALTLLQYGCTRQTQDGGTTVYTFAPWVPISVLTAGFAIFAIGAVLLVLTRYRGWGWGLIITGPALAVVLAPGLFLDKATVDDDHFTLRVGFWFLPSRFDVAFANVKSIQVEVEERRNRGNVTKSYFLLCQLRSGGSDRVPVGDLMKQGAARRILDLARRRGIPVNGDI